MPASSLEHFILGRLVREPDVSEPVPPDVERVYPAVKGKTIRDCIIDIGEKGRRHLMKMAKLRKPVRKKGGKMQILTRSGKRRQGVAFVPASEDDVSQQTTSDEEL